MIEEENKVLGHIFILDDEDGTYDKLHVLGYDNKTNPRSLCMLEWDENLDFNSIAFFWFDDLSSLLAHLQSSWISASSEVCVLASDGKLIALDAEKNYKDKKIYIT